MPDEFDEESELKKRIRRIVNVFLSLLLIILFLSLLVPSDVITSLMESKRVINSQIRIGNKTIIFDPRVYENLKTYYIQHQLSEFKLCLQGEIKDSTYHVNSFYVPKILFATPISVQSIICDQSTIIDLHSHPFRDCAASEQDARSAETYNAVNTEALFAVMCDIDRFSLYWS